MNKQVTKHFLRNTGILDKVLKKGKGIINIKFDSGSFQGVMGSGIEENYKYIPVWGLGSGFTDIY